MAKISDTTSSKSDILRGCYFFAEADPNSLDPLIDASTLQTYPARAQIFAADDEADGLRIIVSGQVRVWLADPDGRELTLGFLEQGDSFGEIAVLDGLPRTANATATEKVTCLFVPIKAMEGALQTDVALARCLIHSLCELMRRNLGTISSFAFVGLHARLAGILHELALDYAIVTGRRAVFTRRFSQTELALLLGVSREAVNKRLKVMLDDELVAMEDGMIVIPDLDALLSTTKANE